MENYPSLKICGNPISSGGYKDIYNINEASFDIPNAYHEGMTGLPYYFVVSITEYNVQYVLVHRRDKVRSYDGSRDGALKIGISIPKNYRLDDNKSPYDVLMEVYAVMIANNLTLIPGTADDYKYNERMCSPEVFVNILNNYRFSKYVAPYQQMTGTTAALLVTARFREFMSDPLFPQLRRYKEVIVANGGNYPEVVTDVTDAMIPRRPAYSLVVNGEVKPWENDPWEHDIVTVTLKDHDTQWYDVPVLTFSFSDVIKNPANAPAGVVVDTEHEKIKCELTATPKAVRYRVDIDGTDDENEALRKLKFDVGGKLVTLDSDGSLTLYGKDNVSKLEPKYDDPRYRAGIPKIDIINRRIRITMTQVPQQVEPVFGTAKVQPAPTTSAFGTKQKSNTDEPKPNTELELSVLIPLNSLSSKGDRKGTVCLTAVESGLSKKWDVEFELSPDQDYWKSGIIILPKELLTSDRKYKVSVKTDRGLIVANRTLEKKATVPISKAKRTIRPTEVDLTDETVTSAGFFRRIPPIANIGIIILALTIGFFTGRLTNSNEQQTGSDNEQTSDSTDVIFVATPEASLPDDQTAELTLLTEKINRLTDNLDNDDVTFAEIKDLHQSLAELSELGGEYPSALTDKANNYYDVIVAIEELPDEYLNKQCDSKVIDNFKSRLQSHFKNNVLTDSQKELIRFIYKPWTKWQDQKKALEMLKDGIENGTIVNLSDLGKLNGQNQTGSNTGTTQRQNTPDPVNTESEQPTGNANIDGEH